MTLTDITNIANNYTDENFDTSVTIDYANSAISKVNIAVKSKLPLITDSTEEYIGLDDFWINDVIVPYVCWSIKMNDGSIAEAREYLYQFQSALQELKKNKKLVIAEEYQGDGFQTVYPIKQYRGRYKL